MRDPFGFAGHDSIKAMLDKITGQSFLREHEDRLKALTQPLASLGQSIDYEPLWKSAIDQIGIPRENLLAGYMGPPNVLDSIDSLKALMGNASQQAELDLASKGLVDKVISPWITDLINGRLGLDLDYVSIAGLGHLSELVGLAGLDDEVNAYEADNPEVSEVADAVEVDVRGATWMSPGEVRQAVVVLTMLTHLAALVFIAVGGAPASQILAIAYGMAMSAGPSRAVGDSVHRLVSPPNDEQSGG